MEFNESAGRRGKMDGCVGRGWLHYSGRSLVHERERWVEQTRNTAGWLPRRKFNRVFSRSFNTQHEYASLISALGYHLNRSIWFHLISAPHPAVFGETASVSFPSTGAADGSVTLFSGAKGASVVAGAATSGTAGL